LAWRRYGFKGICHGRTSWQVNQTIP